MATIFSRIISGDIPGAIVAAETHWVALLDRFPARPGHLLLIPRAEVALLAALPAPAAVDFGDFLHRASCCLRQTLGCDAISVLIRDGAAAGQEVPHLHCHLIPRQAGDQAHDFRPGSYGADNATIDAALADMADRLSAHWPQASR